MDQHLSYNDIQKLRAQGLLDEKEIAIKSGDLVLAEHVVTKARRIVNTGGILLESNRRVLKG